MMVLHQTTSRRRGIFGPEFVAMAFVALAGGSLAGSEQPASSRAPARAVPATRTEPERAGWMHTADVIFSTYCVQPLGKVLFFDFGTQRLQMWWFGRQDSDGDASISRAEARGRLRGAFAELDRNGDGLLDANEYAVLAPKVPLVVAWLFLGAVFLTFRMSFINVRAFWHAVRLTKGDYDDPNKAGEVSHFQALASALSATVGLGNIAGVAIGVGSGGPGAIFWLIVAGLFGMSSKFTECTLGQLYRKVAADGTVSGGPMHYLRDGFRDLGWGWLGAILATVYAVICMGASFGGGCAFQVGQSLGPIKEQLPFLDRVPWLYGVFLAVMVGVVIIGGIRRIAATAARIVPLMCLVYIVMALGVLGINYDKVLPAFGTIFQQAFTANAIYGGFLGVAVMGIRRAMFSNEAGIGSAAIAHAAAKTDQPVSEGIVALLEPFIDTVMICTVTGLMIVITGVYNQPEYAHLVAANEGARLTSRALASVSSVFPVFLSLTVLLFAYSTMISWSYYGERCWSLLFGRRTSIVYKLAFLGFVVLGSIITAENVKEFSDLMILSLAFPNMLGVAVMSGRVRAELDRYWRLYKSGGMIVRRGRASGLGST